jgi:glycerol-3-phosphate O-acyltransferase / dihydroxyacetone phosphate acyltransferase
MHRPLLYSLARPLLRLAARAYFRRIEIVGGEHIPPDGPVILAANHPQSITDGLILGIATRRVVHYVAHSGLFENPLLRWSLRHAGVIPIHRPRDVDDAAARNEDSFRACRELLEGGGCLGIFPEGTSRDERRVQDFKTGTLRIAFMTDEANDFELGVSIVPVGLSFQSAARFRSRVLVTFGAPLIAAEHREAYESDPELAVRELTDELQRRVRHKVVDVKREELEEFVRDVEHVYKSELLDREELDVQGDSRYERGQKLSREIARAAEYFYEERPELIWSVSESLREYRRKLDRVNLPDRIVREEGASFRGQATRLAILFALGLPFALWGLLWNYLPYRLTGDIARLLTRDRTKTHGTQMTVGSLLFVVFYATYLWYFWDRRVTWGDGGLGGFLLSLPLTGLFARRYLIALGRRRLHLRWAYLQSTRQLLVQKLLALRAEIIGSMDAALEEYLQRQTPHRHDAED